jgi:hypothetical protein
VRLGYRVQVHTPIVPVAAPKNVVVLTARTLPHNTLHTTGSVQIEQTKP